MISGTGSSRTTPEETTERDFPVFSTTSVFPSRRAYPAPPQSTPASIVRQAVFTWVFSGVTTANQSSCSVAVSTLILTPSHTISNDVNDPS